jgi:hypothetical protein
MTSSLTAYDKEQISFNVRPNGTDLPPLAKLREEAIGQFWEDSKLRRREQHT